MHYFKKLYPIFTVIVLCLIWELAVRFFKVPILILPSPSDIYLNLVLRHELFLAFSIPTLIEIFAGFFMAATTGVMLGIMVSFSPFAKSSIYPLLISSQMVPKVAIAPVLTIWFGSGLMAKMFIAFLIAFFPITISTMVGLEAIDPEMVRMFRSMGSGPYRTFMKLRLPAALPNIFAGLKIGMSLAVVGAVVAEFVAADRGLGYYLLYANGQLDSPGVFSALVLLTLIGVTLYYAVEFAEYLLVPGVLHKETDLTKASM
ncbi:MAG: ABC transporter permease [Betaproteobacteria bacterium]|jgi:NitT/TauT family transport system permease protein|nr:ABC transporter permease [Betaproteobacteria bacterium]NBY07652.1 ABC transporter permease [Betaproteobacteria bacterium]